VDDTLVVRGSQRGGNLNRPFQQLFKRQRPALDAVPKRGALEQFQRQERAPFPFPDVEDGADPRVAQGRNRARLALKPLQRLRVLHEIVGQEFQRDAPAQPHVLGTVHHPMPPPPSLATTW
jgi:hypothetical protein